MHRGRLSTGTILPLVAGITVFAFACGSSSVPRLGDIGRPGRWVMLFALLAAALKWAAERRPGPRPGWSVVAAGGAFALLALISSLWSVELRVSFERAVTLAVLFAASALIAYGAPGRIERVLLGLLGGGLAIAAAGIVVLLVDHRDAVQPATTGLPARYQGLGQSPDTSSLLLALLTAPSLWFAIRAPSRRDRLAALGALALVVGSIVASGSHGAMVASAAGALTLVLALPFELKRRSAAVVAIAAVTAVGFWVQSLPQPAAHASPAAATTSSAIPQAPVPKPGYTNAEINFPRDGELGIPPPGATLTRGLITSSGRLQAWGGAIRQAEQRPVAGYGFGTESRVFVDRWSRFVGGVPENSYIGIALQLGVAGLACFAVLVLAVAAAGLRGLRGRDRGAAAACLGVVAAGLVVAVVQSYVYSVGDIGTVTLWVAAFLLPATVVAVRSG